MLRRLATSAAVASIALLAVAAPASAHIDPDPAEAQAGSRLSVGFTVEHGCESSPTVQLDMRLPVGVTDPIAEPVDGWVGSVETVDNDTVVTFTGGPLAADVEGTFRVTLTLPPTPDTTIYFPFVQRCEVGEIRWIGIPSTPGDVLDEPAPAMVLTGPVATAVPSSTASPQTTTEPVSTEPVTTEPVTTDAPATTAPATSSEPSLTTTAEPAEISSDADENGDSGTGTIVFIASMAAVVGLGAFVAWRSRQARAATGGDTPQNGA